MTAQKEKKPPVIDEEVAAWLVANDTELWAHRIGVMDAATRLSKELKREVKWPTVKLAATRCRFFLSDEFKSRAWPTTITSLTSEEWDQVAATINRCSDVLVTESMTFAIRLLRYYGVPANDHIIQNSMAWKKLEKRRQDEAVKQVKSVPVTSEKS